MVRAVITGAVGRPLGTGRTVILCHGLSAAAAVVMACAAQFSQAGTALGVVVVAPLAGLAAAMWGSAALLIVSAGIFAIVTVALSSTQFRHVRGP